MAVDGTWRLALDLPAGQREATVRLTAVGKLVSGSWTDGDESRLFDDGRVEGDRVRWTVSTPGATGPVDVLFDGTVRGNSISGTVEVSVEGAAGEFRGERISPTR